MDLRDYLESLHSIIDDDDVEDKFIKRASQLAQDAADEDEDIDVMAVVGEHTNTNMKPLGLCTTACSIVYESIDSLSDPVHDVVALSVITNMLAHVPAGIRRDLLGAMNKHESEIRAIESKAAASHE